MRILVTAGPTREYIDPVRFISNASSGKMGYAIANACVNSGHDVRLVSGPVSIKPPSNIHLIDVITTAEMAEAVLANIEWCDVLIMAAAPADWRPKNVSNVKIKKDKMPGELGIECTPDILKLVRNKKADRVFVGFAVETGNLVGEAMRKLNEKGLDMVVANDTSSFGSDTGKVTFVTTSGIQEFSRTGKKEIACEILKWVENRACPRRV